MGIFDRLSRLVRSNLNDLIARAENPEKMLVQVIEDMRRQLAQAKQEVAMAIADERRLRGQVEAERKEAQNWERRARLAIGQERDDLAKQALMRGQEHARHAAELEEQIVERRLELPFGGIEVELLDRRRFAAIGEQGAQRRVLPARSLLQTAPGRSTRSSSANNSSGRWHHCSVRLLNTRSTLLAASGRDSASPTSQLPAPGHCRRANSTIPAARSRPMYSAWGNLAANAGWKCPVPHPRSRTREVDPFGGTNWSSRRAPTSRCSSATES